MEWLKNLEHGIIDGINGIFTWSLDFLLKPVKVGLSNILTTLNTFSPEIITLALVFCAMGIMIGPIFNESNKWFGRTFLVLWGGIIWRILI